MSFLTLSWFFLQNPTLQEACGGAQDSAFAVALGMQGASEKEVTFRAELHDRVLLLFLMLFVTRLFFIELSMPH